MRSQEIPHLDIVVLNFVQQFYYLVCKKTGCESNNHSINKYRCPYNLETFIYFQK